jgi:hypothetical protein
MKEGRNGVRVQFYSVQKPFIPAETSFWFQINNVRNPISLKPSSPFTNILLESNTYKHISVFSHKNTIVTTEDTGIIHTKSLT